MIAVLVSTLAALLPIVNPVGALAAYAGLTSTMPAPRVRRQALLVGAYVFAILATFGVVGTLVLSALGITLPALQIAGGLVVAHSGFGMLDPAPRLSDEEQQHATDKAGRSADIAFSPMALPLVAGPGAIGVVIALASRHPGVLDRVGIVLGALVVAAIVAVLLRFGTPVVDRLGPSGIGALTRVVGFLILAIGVELVLHGVLAVT